MTLSETIQNNKKLVIGVVAGTAAAAALAVYLKSRKSAPSAKPAPTPSTTSSTTTTTAPETTTTTTVSPAKTTTATKPAATAAPAPATTAPATTSSTTTTTTTTSSSSSAAAAVAPATTASSTPAPAAAPAMEVYHNGLLGIQLSYPASWVFVAHQTPGIPLKLVCAKAGSSVSVEDDDGVPQVLLTVEDLAGDLDVKTYVERSKATMSETLAQFGSIRFLSQKDTRIGDLRAILLEHEQEMMLPNMGSIALVQLSMIVVKGKRAFSLQYVSPKPRYSEFIAEARQVLNSLRMDDALAVLSTRDLAQMSMVSVTHAKEGFRITVPASLRFVPHPQEGILACFRQDEPFSSVSVTSTVLPEAMSVATLTELNKSRLRAYLGTNDGWRFLPDYDSQSTFAYMEGTNQTLYYTAVRGRHAFGVVVSAMADEFVKKRALFDMVIQSFAVMEPNAEAPGHGEPQEWNVVYQNARYGVSMPVPEGYDLIEETMPGNVVTFAKMADEGSISQLHMMVEHFPTVVTVDELERHLKELSTQFSPTGQAPEFAEERVVQMGSLEGREFRFKHSVPRGEDVCYLNRCTVVGKKAYYLQFGATQSEFRKERETAVRAMDGFEVRL